MNRSRGSSSGSRGHGGGRGRGRGRGHTSSMARPSAHVRHGAHGATTDTHAVGSATPGDLMQSTTADFFSDLVRGRRAAHADPTADARSAATASGHHPAVAADGRAPRRAPADDSLDAGEVIPIVNRDGKGGSQTQYQVSWLELGLCKALIRAVSHLGFLTPTPVQAEAIPVALRGQDVCARAVTGSGKTAAFLLPLLHQLLTRPGRKQSSLGSQRRFIRAIVLLPSRELGAQCHDMLKQLMRFTTELTTALAIGGVALAAQEAALEAVPDIVLATPGRLVDLIHNYRGPNGGINLSGVEVLVLDECDKMLTVTLRDQVIDVVNCVPPETRQMLIFSATMTDDVDEFAQEFLFEPRNIDIGHVALQSQLRQQFVRVLPLSPRVTDDQGGAGGESDPASGALKRKRGADEAAKKSRKKRSSTEQVDHEGDEVPDPGADVEHQDQITKSKTYYLAALCKHYFKEMTLVFTKYRTTAHRLYLLFTAMGFPSVELQGNQTQEERFEAMRRFTSGEVAYLFSTDVASRGLDIKGIRTVINFDLPPTLTAYIHRVGRTARIGSSGTAVSLVHERQDADIMRKILVISGTINTHQVASVKRRDISKEYLLESRDAVDAAFQSVRATLAAEEVEAKIAEVEKTLMRSGRRPSSASPLSEVLAARPKRSWCLSKEERKARDAKARELYDREAEITLNRFQNELSSLEQMERDELQKQKRHRRAEREKKARSKEKEKSRRRELMQKEAKKQQAGVIKKLKQKKIRDARKERRMEAREKSGGAPRKTSAGKKSFKKSRHRGKR